MWKATLDLPSHAPQSFMIRNYIAEPDEIRMSLIRTDNNRILHLRGIGSYSDHSAYLDLETVSLTKEVKGKERKLGVWKWDKDGKMRFRRASATVTPPNASVHSHI